MNQLEKIHNQRIIDILQCIDQKQLIYQLDLDHSVITNLLEEMKKGRLITYQDNVKRDKDNRIATKDISITEEGSTLLELSRRR